MADESKQAAAGPKYRRWISATFNDPAFLKLSEGARYLRMFLELGPHMTSAGVANIGPLALAEALEWPPAKLNRALVELETAGVVKFDRKARLLWIPGRLDVEPPANENVVKSYSRILQEVPACQLRDEAEATIKRFCERLGKPFPERLGESGAVAVAGDLSRTVSRAADGDAVPAMARAAFFEFFKREPTDDEVTELVSWQQYQPWESIADAINSVGKSPEPVRSPFGLIRSLVTTRPRGADMSVMHSSPEKEASRRRIDGLLEPTGHVERCRVSSEDGTSGVLAWCPGKSRDGSGYCDKHKPRPTDDAPILGRLAAEGS